MESKDIINLYFCWLIDQVCTLQEKKNYSEVLWLLYSVTFRYELDRDGNRAADGITLRNKFADEMCIDTETRHRAITGPCTVLEMMVALCDRAAYSMIDDELTDGDDAKHWIFWLMMKNLGLVKHSNADFSRSKAIKRIDIFMDRKYAENGHRGGLFVVKKPRNDLREVELWYQMCWSISEMVNME